MNLETNGKFEVQIYLAFITIVFLHALAAYAVFSVPLPWIAQTATVGLAFYLFCQTKLRLTPGTSIFCIFVAYALIDTICQSIFQDYASFLPVKATSSYLAYISLRFISLIIFVCTMTIAYWLLQKGFQRRLIRDLSLVGGFFSLVAIYIYFAQLYGWYEPPRTRMGTSGGEQSIIFSYAFHRAMGTFREPSHLAEWLILPMFASFACNERWAWLCRTTSMVALLLTGSLTGIVAIVGGLFISLFLNRNFFRVGLVSVGRFILPIGMGMIAFSLIAVSRDHSSFSLTDTIWGRIEPMLSGGVESSDRSYVYDYFKKQNISFFGDGIGNSNLKFTHDMSIDATASFLNVFVNYLLSLGLIGTIIFCFFLIYPYLCRLMNPDSKSTSALFYLGSAYIAWIIAYMVHTEEPSFHFAILYALLIFGYRARLPRAVVPKRIVAE